MLQSTGFLNKHLSLSPKIKTRSLDIKHQPPNRLSNLIPITAREETKLMRVTSLDLYFEDAKKSALQSKNLLSTKDTIVSKNFLSPPSSNTNTDT